MISAGESSYSNDNALEETKNQRGGWSIEV
jgi:hypothetical protein